MKRISLAALGLTCLLGCDSCDINHPLVPTVQSYGSIEGTVRRTDAGSATGATVVVTKTVQNGWSWGPANPPHRNTVAILEADADGKFSFPHLPIGRYGVYVEGDEDYYVDPPRSVGVFKDQVTFVSLTLHRWHQDIEFHVETVHSGTESFVRVHATFMNESADSVLVEADCPQGNWFTIHSEALGSVIVQGPLAPCPSILVVVEPGGNIESSVDLRVRYWRGDVFPLPPGEYEVQAGVGFFDGPFTHHTHRYRARAIRVQVM